jgi:hypothetical protein
MQFGSAWVYYGPQRTVVDDLPLWTPFTYVSFLFVIAAGVHTLTVRLPARWHWTIIPAVPTLLAVAHVTTSLPGAVALYRADNPTLILAGALGSMATAALLAASVARMFVAVPSRRRWFDEGSQHHARLPALADPRADR